MLTFDTASSIQGSFFPSSTFFSYIWHNVAVVITEISASLNIVTPALAVLWSFALSAVLMSPAAITDRSIIAHVRPHEPAAHSEFDSGVSCDPTC